jgi:NAD(P)-dependent dehydrogenase (short-subunit alcohol dehydrogenase family)
VTAGDLRVVVTGASSGIGRCTAERLVGDGARVALWARRADELERLAEALGPRAAAVACDVTDPDAVERATHESEERLGGVVNGLVNAAGLVEPLPLQQLDAEAWARTIDVNVNGSFYPCRAIAERLRARSAGGSIVNLGSELSSFGMPGYVAYCAAKSAVIGLTKALAAELAPDIRVNALCPGPVDTPMLASELELADDPVEARRREQDRPLLARIAQPEEIAEAAVWLLVEARFATGALVPIDGGTTTL